MWTARLAGRLARCALLALTSQARQREADAAAALDQRSRSARTALQHEHHGRPGGEGAGCCRPAAAAAAAAAQPILTRPPAALTTLQFREQKKNNGLLLVAASRGYLGDVSRGGGCGGGSVGREPSGEAATSCTASASRTSGTYRTPPCLPTPNRWRPCWRWALPSTARTSRGAARCTLPPQTAGCRWCGTCGAVTRKSTPRRLVGRRWSVVKLGGVAGAGAATDAGPWLGAVATVHCKSHDVEDVRPPWGPKCRRFDASLDLPAHPLLISRGPHAAALGGAGRPR